MFQKNLKKQGVKIIVTVLKRIKNNKVLITINANANDRTAKLLDFFDVSVSPAKEWIMIKYENIDQIQLFVDCL